MYQESNVAAVIVAAGKSTRMGFDKLFAKIKGVEVVRTAVQTFDEHPFVDEIVVVAGENLPEMEQLFSQYPTTKPMRIVHGGANRTESVKAGLDACSDDARLVAIHDGARPFVVAETITACIETASESGAAAPAVPVKDTIKQAEGGIVQSTLPRATLRSIQTPQVFVKQVFEEALTNIPPLDYELLTDDCMVMERMGYPVKLVQGSYGNYKITTIDDLMRQKGEEKMASIRVGHGYDVHKLVEERPLIIGGVNIPYSMGLAGHSDADVLLHAIADAMLGALALGDIGKHFPDTDPENKDLDSLVLLEKVAGLVHQEGFAVTNIDATILCQQPKLFPYIAAMRSNIANVLNMQVNEVSVKATTEEGLGFTGHLQGIAAHCVLLLSKI